MHLVYIALSRVDMAVLAYWIITFETYWEIMMWKKTEKGADKVTVLSGFRCSFALCLLFFFLFSSEIALSDSNTQCRCGPTQVLPLTKLMFY